MDSAVDHLASRLRFRHFQLLEVLERERSLRAAAQEMHVTQPALSRMLEEIESVFEVKLFERTARGLTPTGHGIAATRSARYILEELTRVPQEIRLGTNTAAVIRIGAPQPVAHGLLPTVIHRLTASKPPVDVVLLERAVPELFHALQAGEVDALVTNYSPQHMEAVQIPLKLEKLYESKYELVAPMDHRFARSTRPIPLADLIPEKWVLPGPTTMLRKEIDWAFRRAGLVPPTPVVEVNSPITSMAMVAHGIGLGFAPSETLSNMPASLVAGLRTSPPLASAPVAMIYHAQRENNKIRALKAALEPPTLSVAEASSPL